MIACGTCGAENADSARFCSACGGQLQPETASHETRKTVTVLFCDAAASTSAGERIDAESLRAVMTRYFDAMRAVVERHGGVVEKFIGDAMMAVIGVPRVHEDDALRAVRASLEIRDRLSELETTVRSERGVSIEWRTGVNTGEVIAGDTASGHRFVSGDAVNIAARLEQAAQPGEILLGAETHRLVHDAVRAEPLEPLTLKGKSEPVAAFRVLGPAESEPSAARLQSRMVGREREGRHLDEAWEQVVNERVCYLFTILGAAGVGKSRIVNDFVSRRGAEARAVYGRCLAYGDGITYWPLGEVVRELAGLTDADDSASGRSKIDSLLEGEADATVIAERLNAAIGLAEGRATPEETAWAARRLFEAVSSRQPLVIILDDLQWAEPALLELIDHVATWALDAPLLLLCLARGELLEARPAWGGGKRYATMITLEPLNQAQSSELVANLVGGADLPSTLQERIVAASEGNPLFVEELIGMLIDEGALVAEDGHWRPVRDLTQLSVPPTINALLAARLDGLPPPQRSVLERGAVEGKVFHRGALMELAPELERGELPIQLLALTRKELLRPDRSEFVGEEAYRFRHLLIRDAAYQAMPKAIRADLHSRFAAWLEGVAGDRLAEYEEIMAYHLEQAYRYRIELGPPDLEAARLAGAAGERLASAGRRAHQRGDMHAAVNLLGRASGLLPRDDPRRVAFLPEFGDALHEAGDLAQADDVLSEGLDLALKLHDDLAAARGETVLLFLRASTQHLETKQLLPRFQALAAEFERLGDSAWRHLALQYVAFEYFVLGQAERAGELLGTLMAGLAAVPPSEYGLLASVLYWGPVAVDPAIAKLESVLERSETDPVLEQNIFRGLGGLYGLRGDFEHARELLAASRSRALELGQRFRAEGVLGHFSGPTEYLAGNTDRAAEILLGAYEAMSATGDQAFASTVAGELALALVEMGEMSKAVHYATIANETAASDDFVSQALSLAAMGRVLAYRGNLPEGEEKIRDALRLVDASDYTAYRGEMLLHLASVLELAGRRAEAEEAVKLAISRFEAKGAIAWAARATSWLPSVR